MNIIPLDPVRRNEAAQVAARAFFDYPMFTFYFPSLARRTRYLAWYLGKVINCALRYGEVYTTPEISGVAFTLPPGHCHMSMWEYIQNGFLLAPFLLGLRRYKQSMECEAFVGQAQMQLMQDQPHYYLWGLVVDPCSKKRGIGRALMQPILAKATAQNMPVYLETHDPKNVAYYQKMGFDLLARLEIPKYNLPIWCMRRAAQAGGA